MALISIAAGGLGWWVPARIQRGAVVAIERAGGSVTYGIDLLPSGLPNPDGRRWCPVWMVDGLGIDSISTVRRASIDFRDTGPRVDYAQLTRLGGLKWLTIHSPLLSEADLARIGGLTQLRRLDLLSGGVGDAGLVHLQGLRDLRSLNLAGTRVTDAGLELLGDMRSLRALDLKQTQVTKDGLRRLRGRRPDLAVAH